MSSKLCKSEGCSQKIDKYSLADLCPPCTHAFKSAQSQIQHLRADIREDASDRRNNARNNLFSGNRGDLSSSSPPGFSNDNMITPPNIDINRMYNTYESMGTTNAENSDTIMKDMFGMLLNLSVKSAETDKLKAQVRVNDYRLERLEAKIGKPDDIAVPLSIAIRNLPLPGNGVTDYQLVQSVFKEINAPNVDPEKDISRVIRQGATAQNWGTVMVEMSSDQARTSIMTTKKVLDHHHNPNLRKLIIKNMKQKSDLKSDIAFGEILKRIPGCENSYITNSGHIREKTPYQRGNPFSQYPQQYSSRHQSNSLAHQPPPSVTANFSASSRMYNVPPPGTRHSTPTPNAVTGQHQPIVQTNVVNTNARPPTPLFSFSGPSQQQSNSVGDFDTLIGSYQSRLGAQAHSQSGTGHPSQQLAPASLQAQPGRVQQEQEGATSQIAPIHDFQEQAAVEEDSRSENFTLNQQ